MVYCARPFRRSDAFRVSWQTPNIRILHDEPECHQCHCFAVSSIFGLRANNTYIYIVYNIIKYNNIYILLFIIYIYILFIIYIYSIYIYIIVYFETHFKANWRKSDWWFSNAIYCEIAINSPNLRHYAFPGCIKSVPPFIDGLSSTKLTIVFPLFHNHANNRI